MTDRQTVTDKHTGTKLKQEKVKVSQRGAAERPGRTHLYDLVVALSGSVLPPGSPAGALHVSGRIWAGIRRDTRLLEKSSRAGNMSGPNRCWGNSRTTVAVQLAHCSPFAAVPLTHAHVT